MAWWVAGAVAAGFVGLGAAVNPSKEEAEDGALRMFQKSYNGCTRSEKTAIDIAVGGPKLQELRDKFQSLFPKPKVFTPQRSFEARQGEHEETLDKTQSPQKRLGKGNDKEYSLYGDPEVQAVFDVHQDTADPAYEYEARYEDLKHLVPFDIETESFDDYGTYNVEDVLTHSTSQRFPEPLTLPRQLGGAATSANRLIDKLTHGQKLGFPSDYTPPGYKVTDIYQPPSDNPPDMPPPEAFQNLNSMVDYRLSLGKFAPARPTYSGWARKATTEDEDESEYEEDEDETEESTAAALPSAPLRPLPQPSQLAGTKFQPKSFPIRRNPVESTDEDESETDD